MFQTFQGDFLTVDDVASVFNVDPAIVRRWPESRQMDWPASFTKDGKLGFSREAVLEWWRKYGPLPLGEPGSPLPGPMFVRGGRRQ